MLDEYFLRSNLDMVLTVYAHWAAQHWPQLTELPCCVNVARPGRLQSVFAQRGHASE